MASDTAVRRISWRRRLQNTIFASVVLLIAGLFCSMSYNYLVIRSDRAHHPVPGNIYSVNGYQMHLYCVGSGEPTVIFEGGLTSDWLIWQKVQPELAKLTRVCTYDRGGLGWSESRPGVRDAISISTQLHELLQTADMKGPLVLAGHSAGGLYIRQYFATYPDHIIGMIFIDASMPEQFKIHPEDSAETKRRQRQQLLWEFQEVSGLARLTGQCEVNLPKDMLAYKDWYQADTCRATAGREVGRELDAFETSGLEVAKTPSLGDLPILIISQDPDRPASDPQDRADQQTWNSLQESLKSLSRHSRRIIARGSGHNIQLERPDVIIDSVDEFVSQLRTEEH